MDQWEARVVIIVRYLHGHRKADGFMTTLYKFCSVSVTDRDLTCASSGSLVISSSADVASGENRSSPVFRGDAQKITTQK